MFENYLKVFFKKKNSGIIGIEDQIFPTTFFLLKVSGSWVPSTVKSRWAYICYHFYTIFNNVNYFLITISIVVNAILSGSEVWIALIESWYTIVPLFDGILKSSNLILRRAKIIKILRKHMMEEDWINYQDEEESAMIKKAKISESVLLIVFLSIMMINFVLNAINVIISNNGNKTLLFESYAPCNVNIPMCFWILYTHHCFGYIIGCFIHVGFDCLIFNFITRLCVYFEIFERKLLKLPDIAQEKMNVGNDIAVFEKTYLKRCIDDHVHIYKIVDELNSTFYEIVSLQFLLTISVICINIYSLSKQKLFSTDFISLVTYLLCVLSQHFLYCWYGYKITQKNAELRDKIFSTNWMLLQKETKKLLLFVMLSTSRNITVFSNALISLTPEMFLKMVRISYSAFNLLHESVQR